MKFFTALTHRTETTRARAGFRRAAAGLLAVLAVLAVAVSGGAGRLAAQDAPEPAKEDTPQSFGHVKNFAVPDYYAPPNQNQMRYLMRGAEGELQPNGQVQLKNLQLETYNTNGGTQMIVRAPDCTYDQNAQTASSSNRIEAASGDGKLYIEGEGYRWDKTNSVFVISNKVHTLIRQETATTAAP